MASYKHQRHPNYTVTELGLMGAVSTTDRQALTVEPAPVNPAIAKRAKNETPLDTIRPPDPVQSQALSVQSQLFGGVALIALILAMNR